MVTLLPSCAEYGESKRFKILVEGDRFKSMVTGHSVRNRPLCPASFYLESIAMAVDLLNEGGDLKRPNLEFEGLDIQAPLGIGAQDVEIMLQELSDACHHQQWEFSIVSRQISTTSEKTSSLASTKSEKTTLHARGRVAWSSTSKLATMARLIGSRMQALASDDRGVEKMLSRRAYDLFSRVVDYDKFLQGISSITICGTEAIGKVCISPSQPGLDESTVVGICDTVSLDNFIQVVGLLINTSDIVGRKEVMICTGVDTTMIASGCNMVDCRSWKVYSSYTAISSSQAIGDVFAFSEIDGSVAAAFTGCRFAKLDVTRLERLLDSTNQVSSSKHKTPPNHLLTPISVPLLLASTQPLSGQYNEARSPTQDSDSSWVASELDTQSSSDGDDVDVRVILETYIGVAAATIPDGAVLGDLGLDSLAAVEMAEDLATSGQAPPMNSQDLLSMTVQQLEQRANKAHARRNLTGSRQDKTARAGPILAENSLPPQINNHRPRSQSATASCAHRLTELLVEITGVAAASITPWMTLEELGVDSLALTEIQSSLTDMLSSQTSCGVDNLSLRSTFDDIVNSLGSDEASCNNDTDTDSPDDWEAVNPREIGTISFGVLQSAPASTPVCPSTEDEERPTVGIDGRRGRTDPRAGLRFCESQFESAAKSRGFNCYWNDVALKQGKLCLAYILEAFQTLGVDLASLSEGELVPQIRHQPKHSKMVGQLWGIVEKHGIISWSDAETGRMIRTSSPVSTLSSSRLDREFQSQYPAYSIEARLLAITGPKLAACLTGDADPIKLLFGTASSREILADYYSKSPMLSTLTSQLVAFVMGSLESPKHQSQEPAKLRILEVGAGTGGTTAELAESLDKLHKSGVTRVEYVFTDISLTMIAKARTRFSHYRDWMSFEKVDLEHEPAAHLAGKFDIVLGTNCVHATKDRIMTTRHIRRMLNSKGFMVLSEITRVVDWLDLVFGLLDGWWLAEDGRSYPLQSAESWMGVFREAGFGGGMFSQGKTEDANTQQLLIGCNFTTPGAPDTAFMRHLSVAPLFKKETAVYKEVAGLKIEADIFLPTVAPTRPMPIALMIHGGGYMTLSRRAVRPAQTAHLLAHGVMPVSIDYRLCPEINIVDGAMADARDAFIWAKRTLPSLVASRGIVLDTEQIVVVGWSTGGHLAMSTAWTLEAAGESLPKAILVFYAPTDWLAADVFSPRPAISRIPPRLSREQVLQIGLLPSPITNYETMNDGEGPGLGWVKPGDARSELLLSILRQPRDFALSIMLNGTQEGQRSVQDLVVDAPPRGSEAAVCPTARLCNGEYKVPTFIIHGDADELALFRDAERFHELMVDRGIKSGFLHVKNGVHIHDLRLKPGMSAWEEQVAPGYRFLLDILGC